MGNITPTYGFTGEQTPTGTPSEAGMSDGESLDNQENGQYYSGTPNSHSNGDLAGKFSRRSPFEDVEGHSLGLEGSTYSLNFSSFPSPSRPKDIAFKFYLLLQISSFDILDFLGSIQDGF